MDTCDFLLTPEETSRMLELHSNLSKSYKIGKDLENELKDAKKKIVENLEELERARFENNKLKEAVRERQYEGDQIKRKYVHLKEKYKSLEEKNNSLEAEVDLLRQFKTSHEQKVSEAPPVPKPPVCKNASIQCTPSTNHASTLTDHRTIASPSTSRGSRVNTRSPLRKIPRKSPLAPKQKTPPSPQLKTIDKKSEAGKLLLNKFAPTSFLQQAIVQTDKSSPGKRAMRAPGNDGWLNTGKGQPRTTAVVAKPGLSPRKLNLSLTKSGRLKQTNLTNFAKQINRVDPDETFCTELENNPAAFNVIIPADKPTDKRSFRTVSSEDLFEAATVEISRPVQSINQQKATENQPLDSQILNTGMIAEPAQVKKESSGGLLQPRKRKLPPSEVPKEPSASEKASTSVIILPTPRDSPILIEDSVETEAIDTSFRPIWNLEQGLIPLPAPADIGPIHNIPIDAPNNSFSPLDADATYCAGFTDAQPRSPVIPKKKRSREVVQQEENEKNKYYQVFTCKECEDYFNAAYSNDKEHLQKMAKRCAEKHQRENYHIHETPAGFWDIDFPPTQEIMERNKRNAEKYKEMLKEDKPKKKSY